MIKSPAGLVGRFFRELLLCRMENDTRGRMAMREPSKPLIELPVAELVIAKEKEA